MNQETDSIDTTYPQNIDDHQQATRESYKSLFMRLNLLSSNFQFGSCIAIFKPKKSHQQFCLTAIRQHTLPPIIDSTSASIEYIYNREEQKYFYARINSDQLSKLPHINHARISILPKLQIEKECYKQSYPMALGSRSKQLITIPVNSPKLDIGLVYFTGNPENEWENRELKLETPNFHHLAHQIISEKLEFSETTCTQNKNVLTKRQTEILGWVALGKTSWEISRILELSENTILWHIRKAHESLRVSNRYQAVAKAVELKLI